MASVMRYRRGNCNPVALPTDSTKPIEVGDLCVIQSSKVVPASAMADAGDAAANRVASKAVFAGVALHKSGLQSGETTARLTGSIDPGYNLIATAGQFEFDCAATAWVDGDLVGIYSDATTNSNQKVAKVTTYTEAIGVAVVPFNAIGAATSTVIVELRSVERHNTLLSGQ